MNIKKAIGIIQSHKFIIRSNILCIDGASKKKRTIDTEKMMRDPLKFLIETEGLSCLDALQSLLKICGVDVKVSDVPGGADNLLSFLRKCLRPNDIPLSYSNVLGRYYDLCEQHDKDKREGKPGWMKRPRNQLRDELAWRNNRHRLMQSHPSISDDFLYVRNPAQIITIADEEEEISWIEPDDASAFVAQLAQAVYEKASGGSGSISFAPIYELCKNFAHAYYENIVVKVYDQGRRIDFSDDGPGLDPTKKMGSSKSDVERWVQGVKGELSGLNMVEAYGKSDGFMVAYRNLDKKNTRGLTVTLLARDALRHH